jgi:hydrogenase expression/formation protein HypD
MKYLDEYRDPASARRLVAAIRALVSRPWRIMEVCGGQTHGILRFGLDQLLPAGIDLIHGPGCPVCVTPLERIDQALAIAQRPGVTFCSFGDMLRVPGSGGDLLTVKAQGGDVRVVYSPLDAVALARARPDREVVFFAVGFETTAPANALAVLEARRLGLRNFSMLVAQVTVTPAMAAILAEPDCKVDGFLAAGHVCTVMGIGRYRPLAARHRVPIVVTGFEPLDLLEGLFLCLRQLEQGRHEVEIPYRRLVRAGGNRVAQARVRSVFQLQDRAWRGLGVIPGSGLGLRERFAAFDAARRFPAAGPGAPEPAECQAGRVLRGLLKPPECPAFGSRCRPEHPLGAPMVSAEGACAAYFRYRHGNPEEPWLSS